MSSYHALLGRLQKMRLLVKTRKRGIHKGSRQSSHFGSSLEFSDFRVYQPGDDVRQIDWNVFGRTQKHYIKRFLDEQELSIAIYLDSTSSMRQIQSKWEFAKGLAALLSYVVLASEDRLVFSPVASKSLMAIRRKGAVSSRRTYLEILGLDEGEQTGEFIANLHNTVSKNQQLSILISDGLEPLDRVEALLKKLSSLKQEIWFLQVLSSEEISPSYLGDLKLIDSESDAVVNVSLNPGIVSDYEKRLMEHNRELEKICRRYGGHFISVSDQDSMQSILFHELPSRGLIR
ncbi:DUF58 domain-containing protein [Pseudoneobacillus rhizosphaerae]|uniref:DUF58 domain-containing protein n=1 Tax=Pseudoneobacillus rhizosphaerae TaxID=2880968 RepID=A0A9C7G778_9BACI|nr:DUF58 domain-containing protein [Pseudoneobacillus rhizosphaerae]CAG9606772.1 hypothetical protein NEOCIP111885_00460 [Pseudoneobacillus rhizosphaerae]